MPSIISAGTTAGTAINISGDTTGNLAFQTNGTTTAMTINTSQNVGIGTTTPAYPLTVGDSSSSSSIAPLNAMLSTNTGVGVNLTIRKSNDGANTPGIAFAKSRGTAASPTIVQSGDSTNSIIGYGYDGSNYIASTQILSTVDGTPGTNDMPGRITFLTTPDNSATPAERMRINSLGNVGIGTTSPAGRLDVAGAPATNGSARTLLYVSDTNSLAADNGGGITFRAIVNTGGDYFDAANIKGIKENATSDNNGGSLVFSTHAAFGSPTERMRITNGGNVGIGTTGPAQRLTVAGGAFIYDGGSSYSGTLSVGNNISGDARPLYIENQNTGATSNGMIYVNNFRNNTDFGFLSCFANNNGSLRAFINGAGTFGSATGVYGGVSDARIKKDIVDTSPKLNKLMQVRVVNYTRIDDPDEKRELGVIAQELESVFPGLVYEEEVKKADGEVICPDRKNVKYSVFVPMLIKAIQEQQAMIEELKAEVQVLKEAK
jgi:hypothetical protein